MTREDVINELRKLEYYGRPFDNSKEQGEKAIRKAQALAMAIQILEQEPCEDVISRQAAKNAICDYVCGKGIRCVEEHECRMKKMISELSSVQPKPKTGHWIELTKLSCAEYSCYVCSECEAYAKDHSRRLRVQNRKSLFCPDCGLKMVEPQESEE